MFCLCPSGKRRADDTFLEVTYFLHRDPPPPPPPPVTPPPVPPLPSPLPLRTLLFLLFFPPPYLPPWAGACESSAVFSASVSASAGATQTLFGMSELIGVGVKQSFPLVYFLFLLSSSSSRPFSLPFLFFFLQPARDCFRGFFFLSWIFQEEREMTKLNKCDPLFQLVAFLSHSLSTLY